MKLEINRKEWRRGPQPEEIVTNDPTSLLCKDGTKCCLGFYALQCGLPEVTIKGLGEPSDLSFSPDDELPEGMEKLVKFEEYDEEFYSFNLSSTELTNGAIEINDSARPEEERERDLIALFAKHGVEVVIYG